VEIALTSSVSVQSEYIENRRKSVCVRVEREKREVNCKRPLSRRPFYGFTYLQYGGEDRERTFLKTTDEYNNKRGRGSLGLWLGLGLWG
jgi:hypothetical protein